MYRNLFAVFATLALGAGAASASTLPTEPGKSLEQRVMAAQKTIGAAMNATDESTVKTDSGKLAQYYYNPFRNFSNHPYYQPPFRNFSNSYYGY